MSVSEQHSPSVSFAVKWPRVLERRKALEGERGLPCSIGSDRLKGDFKSDGDRPHAANDRTNVPIREVE